MPSNYTAAASVAQLIADINAADAASKFNTITLVDGTAFTLTAVNNTSARTTIPLNYSGHIDMRAQAQVRSALRTSFCALMSIRTTRT